MRIIKGTEPIPVEHPVILIFGQPGICKTSLGYSMPDPLLLDFDKGSHRAANRRDTAQIDTWGDVADLNSELEAYKSVTVDTVGRCLDVITADIAATDPKKAPGGNLSQQGWGVLKNRFRTWTSTLRGQGKYILLLAHDKEDKDGETRIVRPDIVGGSYAEVMKIADFVGYLYKSGRDRILDFEPTDRWVGKNPAGWDAMKVPPVAKASDFMADLVTKGRDALGAISAESAKVMTSVDGWRQTIAKAETPEAATALVSEIGAIAEPIVSLQAKKLLLDHATAKGFKFDKQTKKFVVEAAA